jgi:hypothetical protein
MKKPDLILVHETDYYDTEFHHAFPQLFQTNARSSALK